MRACLTAPSAARASHGPNLQLAAAAADRFSRVPPAAVAALGEAATSAQLGGHSSLGNDGDDDALASMIMPLGFSALQVQSSAVKA